MNCLEAQSYIMPFIDGKIPEHKQEEFVLHMKSCPKCHEELEIYYTLIVGMKQLDNKEELSSDFSRDLEIGLNHMRQRVKGRRRIRFSTFSFVCLALIAVMIVFYGQCLNRVYAYEQNTKLNNQGTYYFYRELDSNLLLAEIDRIEESKQLNAEEEVTFYDKVQVFNTLNEINTEVLNLGREIMGYE